MLRSYANQKQSNKVLRHGARAIHDSREREDTTCRNKRVITSKRTWQAHFQAILVDSLAAEDARLVDTRGRNWVVARQRKPRTSAVEALRGHHGCC